MSKDSKTGSWVKIPGGNPAVIDQQKKTLTKLRDLLEEQLRQDRKRAVSYQEILDRIQSGGGS